MATVLLEAEDLCAQVGERRLFSGLNLSLMPGQTLLLRGPSGSGKTVLLRILAGQRPADDGRVLLHGQPLERGGGPRWRSQLVLVPQHPVVLPGAPVDTWAAWSALKVHRGRQLGDPQAHAAAMDLPAGAWTQPWTGLSGGERQRLHIALAIALQPVVLLLDEPTAALDAGSVERVEALLRGHTAVWISHDEDQHRRLAADHTVSL